MQSRTQHVESTAPWRTTESRVGTAGGRAGALLVVSIAVALTIAGLGELWHGLLARTPPSRDEGTFVFEAFGWFVLAVAAFELGRRRWTRTAHPTRD
jgi:hypothetical protein